MAEAYRSIACIQKTHGRKGEVVAVPTHGLPNLLCEGMRVALVPPALKGPRSRVVEHAVSERMGQLVSFVGVRSLDDAESLVGRTVLARVADLPRDVALHDVDALVGRDVRDATDGPLGTIQEVMRGPANDVWVVRGSRGEVLVPVVDEFVLDFATEDEIVVDLPRGLVGEDS